MDHEGWDIILVPDVMKGVASFEGGVDERSQDDEEKGKDEES